MTRHALALIPVVLAAACAREAPPAARSFALQSAPLTAPLVRQHLGADVYHYQFDVPVGDTANARVRLHRVTRERAPFLPRPTRHAILLLHGDFSTFVTNFAPTLGDPASSAPGLAPWLAAHDIDVWGVDRRWTLPAAAGDTSDFDGMGLAQELADVELGLALARATRAVTDGDGGPLVLGGFSHGAELTYAYAAADGRHVAAIVPIDIYYDLAPADADLRASACASVEYEQAQLAAGIVDADNSTFVQLGQLARSAPDDPSPVFGPRYTNREGLLTLVGVTWKFVPFTPKYHLNAPILDDAGKVTGLRETAEERVSPWFAGAAPHQSMREGADLDAIWCGQAPRPELARIDVPLFYLGAAGGFGDHGLYSTTRVSSRDVTALVVRRFGDERVAEDFGHGDLLYAADAPALAWRPLLAWLRRH